MFQDISIAEIARNVEIAVGVTFLGLIIGVVIIAGIIVISYAKEMS